MKYVLKHAVIFLKYLFLVNFMLYELLQEFTPFQHMYVS